MGGLYKICQLSLGETSAPTTPAHLDSLTPARHCSVFTQLFSCFLLLNVPSADVLRVKSRPLSSILNVLQALTTDEWMGFKPDRSHTDFLNKNSCLSRPRRPPYQGSSWATSDQQREQPHSSLNAAVLKGMSIRPCPPSTTRRYRTKVRTQ